MISTQLPPAAEFVARPGKLVRITAVARAMLEEARATPCDAAACERFRNIYERTIAELDGVVSADLHAELIKLAVRFDDAAASASELRVAQAELVGWLDGLMNGIAIALQAREIAAENEPTVDTPVVDDRLLPGQYL